MSGSNHQPATDNRLGDNRLSDPDVSSASPDAFDLLLRDHLSRELDPHLGKAAARFTAELARPSADARSQGARRHGLRRPGGWWLGFGGVGLAAGIALVLALPALRQFDAGPVPSAPARSPSAPVEPVFEVDPPERALRWRTYDEGTVFIDDQPMRSIRRERFEQARWWDPDANAYIEVTVPHRERVLVGMNKY